MNFIGICMCHLMRAWPDLIWLLVDSSWLLLIQPDHYSILLICDVTNDMGFLYSLFQYKSDCTKVAKVITFDRFQIMARDLTSIAAMTPTKSPAESTRGPHLVQDDSKRVHLGIRRVHNKSRMGPRLIHDMSGRVFLRFESSPILSFYAFYISCPVNTCRWTIVQINHCKIVHEIHHFFETRFFCFYWFYITW